VYKLAATPAPVEFINEKLSAVKLPTLKLEQKTFIARGVTGELAQDKVRAYVDSVSGDVHFVPNLLELAITAKTAQPLAAERAQTIARTALTDIRFIPRDVTTLKVSNAITVSGATAAREAGVAREAPRVVMTLVPAIRYAGGLRVYGRGSHALVSIANDSSVVGALRRWRTASLGDKIKPIVTAAQVRADIQRQLAPYVTESGSHANVSKIEIANYDGNANYIQPVYYFEAVLTPGDKQVSGSKIAGYVPIGKTLEPIPDLAARATGVTPSTSIKEEPQRSLAKPELESAGGTGPAYISVGEFVNQKWPTESAYLDMANSFMSGLNTGHTFVAAIEPPFSRTIWWTAYPWQVVGPSSKSWMNAVNIAYTVPHGNWLYNTTLSNNAQGWYVPNIGTGGNPGFGSAAGGVLATWVIMSCEVIPSMYDRQNEAGAADNPYTAFDAWWPVFQGLHNVIGFRTEMLYPDDSLNYGFGFDAALGGDINAAWFNEVAAYDGDDGTYNDGHLIGNPAVHWDRASTMIDARNLGQSIYSVGAQSASSQLWNFWMYN
jgi:hypothetical protein